MPSRLRLLAALFPQCPHLLVSGTQPSIRREPYRMARDLYCLRVDDGHSGIGLSQTVVLTPLTCWNWGDSNSPIAIVRTFTCCLLHSKLQHHLPFSPISAPNILFNSISCANMTKKKVEVCTSPKPGKTVAKKWKLKRQPESSWQAVCFSVSIIFASKPVSDLNGL